MKKWVAIIFFILAFQYLFPLPAQGSAAIKVGIYRNEPKVYVDAQGKPAGIWIDLLEHIAQKEGWHLKYVFATWQQCLEHLKSGEIDLLVDVGYSEERAQIYRFNQETVISNWAQIYTHKSLKLDDIQELAGKKLAAMKEDISYKRFKLFNIPCKFILCDDYSEVFRAIESRAADAGIISRLFGDVNANKYPVRKAAIVLAPIELRFAFTQNTDTARIVAIDRHLKKLKNDQNSFYHQTLDKWFSPRVVPYIPKKLIIGLIIAVGLFCVFAIFSILLKKQVHVKTRELEKSERRYRTHFEKASDIIYAMDSDFTIIDISPSVERILGYRPEELQGKRFPDLNLLAPEDLERAISDTLMVCAGEEIGAHVYAFITRNGRRVYAEIRSNLIIEDGHGKKLYSVARDVTERKCLEGLQQAQKDLALELNAISSISEGLNLGLKTVLSASGLEAGGIYLVDETSGALDLKCHQGLTPSFVEAVSHYNADSLNTKLVMEGKPVYLFYGSLEVPLTAPEEKEGLRAMAVLPLRYLARVIGCLNVASFNFDQIPEFSRQFLETTASIIGNAVARLQTGEKLKKSEERLRNTLDFMLEGCQIIGFDWRYLYVNNEVIKQSRRAKEELLGHKIMDVYPDITSTKMFAALQRCMDDRSHSFIENEFTYPDGAKSWFYISIQPVSEGIFILSMDITQQKHAQEREKHLNAIIKAIRNVNQLITKEKDRDRLIQGACDNLVSTRGYNSAWIMLTDAFERSLYSAQSGLGEKLNQLKELREQGQLPQCVQRAMAQKEVVITADTSIDCPGCPLSSVYKGNSAFCVKLECNGRVYGTLTASIPQTFALDQEEQSLFQEVGDDIAFGLYNIEQEEKRSKMVKELSYSEARHRAVFEGTAEGILIAETESKEFRYANPAICQMLGYTQDELKKMGVKDIHPPNDLDRVISEFEVQAKHGKVLAQDIPCLRKDGTIFYAEFNTTQTMIDGVSCNVGFVTEVTERKKLIDALKESEERFKTLFEFAPDAYYLHNLEGRLIDGNRAAEKLVGYSKEELIGKSFIEMELLDPEGLQKAAELLQKSVQGLSTGPVELILKQKDGKQVFIEIRTFPISIKGQKLVLGIARDISERKSLEQQLQQFQKLEAIGRLSGGVAHDFNNLLTAVIGNAEFILTDLPKDNPLRSGIEEIISAGERGATLTRQLLAFSRKQVLQPKVINLNNTVRDMEKMLHRMIREDIELRTVLTSDLGQVEADPSQIEQVIMNLVVNARDAISGGGKISIETGNVDLDEEYARTHIAVKAGPYVMLSVSDTGIGMSREIQAKIFEPFFTTKEKEKGTGLGLSTVYGIVKQSNGNIWVYSEPGKGTTFKVYLPRVEKTAPEAIKMAKQSDTPTGAETILVVEDDEMVRNFAVRVLRGYGYKILIASNGEEAVRISGEHQGTIHLMLTDVVMTGISSRDVEEILKSSRPEMKVLFMSGYTDNTIVHHGVLDTGKAFIGKPFTPNALGRKVREVLDLTEVQQK